MKHPRICKKGHSVTGRNVSWHTTRGRRYRRCRLCYNAQQRLRMRRNRKDS